MGIVTSPRSRGVLLASFSIVIVLALVPALADAGVPFKRGDVDGNGTVHAVIDAIALVDVLFSGAPCGPLLCQDAADVNDDGGVDFSDAIYLLAGQFAGGPPPPAPGPFTCGDDPTADGLSCDSYTACSPPILPEDGDFVFSLTNASGEVGEQVTVEVRFDVLGNPVSGWQLSVCHGDPEIDIVSVQPGVATLTSNNGGPPDYLEIDTRPGEGWTTGVIINFTQGNMLPPGIDYQLYEATYDVLGMGTFPVTPCDNLNSINTRVSVGCSEVNPARQAGTVTGLTPGGYQLSVTGGQGLQGSQITSSVRLDSSSGQDLQGWSFGVCHDSGLLAVNWAGNGATTLTVNQGSPPDFYEYSLFADGWTGAVVICFTGCDVLPPGIAHELAVAGYSLVGSPGSSTSICFCDTLGTPPVETILVEDGGIPVVPSQICGNVQILQPTFRRGDSNNDSLADITDAVHILLFLFQGGSAPPCPDAADVNDDEAIDASDAVYLFDFYFNGGPAIPPPFANCGLDPSGSALECPTAICF